MPLQRGSRRDFAAWQQDLVLHPFVGYVEDPNQPVGQPLSPEGYSLVRGQGSPVPDARFTVAVFGGSLAQHLCLGASRVLRQELAGLPAAAGRPVWIDCYALGGYKQPQQTMALTYALARGVPIDLVINLDGFNDISLAVAENLPKRVNPYYPRSWHLLTAATLDRDLLRQAGEVAYLEGRRAEAAAAMDRLPIRWSAVAHALWRASDRWTQRRIAGIEGAKEGPRSARAFQRHGPPYPARPPAEVVRDLAELWGRSSRLMDGLCRSKGIPYFHFLQPNQYVPGSKPMGDAERRVALNEESAYGAAARRGYPDLVAVGRRLRSEGESFFDLTPVFAKTEEPLYIDDCCHLNVDGLKRLAHEIGTRIREAQHPRPLVH